jgi:predicted enzyme related to lactoylglutathione lyase
MSKSQEQMARVTGIGGVFIRARDPAALAKWYEKHLGIVEKPGEGISFRWSEDPDPNALTVFSIFDADDDYWERTQPVMLNFRVDGLDELIAKLAGAGVTVLERAEDHEYGRFRWIVDPEGNRIELWEPRPH